MEGFPVRGSPPSLRRRALGARGARARGSRDAVSQPDVAGGSDVHAAGACYADGITMIASVVLAYALGSIPFALLAARLSGADLRRVGSGNIGAANVMRASGV